MSELSGRTAGSCRRSPNRNWGNNGTRLVRINKAGYVSVDPTLFMAIVSLFQRSEVNQRE
jgi:hypothetical protein